MKIKRFFTKILHLKIRITTVLITGYIIFSTYLNYHQREVIQYYGNAFEELDYTRIALQTKMDSLTKFLVDLSVQEVFVGNVENNLINEYVKLQNEPLLFAKNYLDSKEISLGGGE